MITVIKRGKYICIIFIITSIFISSLLNSIENSVSFEKSTYGFLSKDYKTISIKEEDEKYANSLKSDLKDYMIFKDITSNNCGVYINGDITCKIPLIEGRFFESYDYNKNEKNIVIGKGLRKRILNKNGENYIPYNNDLYKVIGIVGDEKVDKTYDFQLFYPIELDDNTDITGEYILDAEDNTENVLSDMKLLNNNVQINEIVTNNEATMKSMIETSLYYSIKDKMEVILIIFLNIFIVTEFWIKGRKKEIAVRKMVGGKNFNIKIKVILELLFLSSISYFIGYLMFIAIFYITNGYFKLYFTSIMGLFTFTIISSLLSAIIPMKYITKMQPGQAIK